MKLSEILLLTGLSIVLGAQGLLEVILFCVVLWYSILGIYFLYYFLRHKAFVSLSAAMKNKKFRIVLGVTIFLTATLIFSWYWHQNREVSVISQNRDENAIALAKVSPNCAKYYGTLGQGPDPITNELSDFVNLYPLSDFLCGDYSDIASTTLADGKVLYFVDPIAIGSCGSGGCQYYPLLEEKPGLVRHIRGFDEYSYPERGITYTPPLQKDVDGTVFGFLSFPKNGEVEAYWHLSAECGITNIYKFNIKDEPVLISAFDNCLPGDGTLYQSR